MRGAFLPVADQPLPEFAGKVVDVLGVQTVQGGTQPFQQEQDIGEARAHGAGLQASDRQVHDRQVVNFFNDPPCLEQIVRLEDAVGTGPLFLRGWQAIIL